MLQQTGPQVDGETGNKKNCNEWAVWEPPGSSYTALLCNGGGKYKGDWYEKCPSSEDCKIATIRKTGKHMLPVLNDAKPFGAPGSQLVASSPNLTERLGRPFEPWRTPLPTTIPQRTDGKLAPQQMASHLPFPVTPPADWPASMRTPYVAPTRIVGITPTFLPADDENIVSRLLKNILQGWVGATGWHIFDFTQAVDLFGNRRNP